MLAIHRHLLMQLVVRDVAGRYKGSIEGLAWTVCWRSQEIRGTSGRW